MSATKSAMMTNYLFGYLECDGWDDDTDYDVYVELIRQCEEWARQDLEYQLNNREGE
jgi:hypothetical protein